MINVNWNKLGKGDELFTEELQEILKGTWSDDGKYKPIINLILVLLEEPTTDTKKKLRIRIENEFKGEFRRTILRKIVPVISPPVYDEDLDDAYAQFADDLIYFEDNYAGVGLWPLAQEPCAHEVNKLIVENFKSKVGQDFIGHEVTEHIPQLCNWACPNRWLLHILIGILAVVLIPLAILFLSNCHLRVRIKGFFRTVLGLLVATILVLSTFLVLSTTLVCDPLFNEMSNDVTIGLLLFAVVILVWRYVHKRTQGKLP